MNYSSPNDADLTINYDPTLNEANEIAKQNIRMCMGENRCGCRGVPPAGKGYEDGVWLADALWAFIDGIIYWVTPKESKSYLYSEDPKAMGVISFFANLQEKTGEHAGNIPVAKYKTKDHGWMGEYDIDYGGMFDLAYVPRKNHRDEAGSGFFFIEAMHRYWKYFNDESYLIKYYDVMRKYINYRLKNIDEKTGLFRSTYGLGDVCIDYAVPKSCALIYNNAFCYATFKRFSEIAKAIGKSNDAEKYWKIAEKMKKGINTYLWDEKLGYYKIKIFCNPTTNKNSPAYGITEDNHFFVAGNMMVIYFEIPDNMHKIKTLMANIEKADGKLKLYGQSVEPPYPNGWHNKIFNDGTYWNGDVWPCFGSWYAIALFRLGYPDEALRILSRQAEVAVRDKGFYEYYEDDEEGAGKGAFYYCFTAAPYQAALVRGLFGLDADYPNRRIYIHPSLRHSGSISCQLGAHNLKMSADVENHQNKIILTIDTTYSGQANFKVLVKNGVGSCEVTKDDGTNVPCYIKRIGKANYVIFDTNINMGLNVLNISVS
ncbi:hypothetical protein J7L27_00455 [Candidatus Bathyarchaeota archaeon]|nr:hypothetical protein [Candidatus Bathyarchaeota archaeon]